MKLSILTQVRELEVARESETMQSLFLFFPFLTQLEWNTSSFLIVFFLAGVAWLSLGGPAWILSVASGFAYGVLWGSVFTIFAMMLAACCVYFVSLIFSNASIGFVSRHALTADLKEILKDKNGFLALFLLKLNPLIPFMPVVVFSALVRCPLTRVLLASACGALPLNLLWCFQGSTLASFSSLLISEKATLLNQKEEFFYLLFLIVVTIVLIVFLNRALKKFSIRKYPNDKKS